MRDDETERDRMPHIQIETGQWVVMRNDKWRPKAVIRRVGWHDGSEQFMLMTWHSTPAERKLVGIYESLEAANRAVPWRNPKPPPMPFPPFSRDDPR